MAITVNPQRMEIIFIYTKEGTGPVVLSCKASYRTTCNGCGEVRAKSITKILTPTQENSLKAFGATVLAELEAKP